MIIQNIRAVRHIYVNFFLFPLVYFGNSIATIYRILPIGSIFCLSEVLNSRWFMQYHYYQANLPLKQESVGGFQERVLLRYNYNPFTIIISDHYDDHHYHCDHIDDHHNCHHHDTKKCTIIVLCSNCMQSCSELQPFWTQRNLIYSGWIFSSKFNIEICIVLTLITFLVVFSRMR